MVKHTKWTLFWTQTINLLQALTLRVCVPSLVLVETGQDKTGGHFQYCQDRDKTTCAWSHCLGHFEKNSGRDVTT